VFILLAAIGIAALAHIAPFPFLLDVTKHTIWSMPETPPPTVYLTFDDGPNPALTPALLDVLDRHGVRATFFVIDKYVSNDTAPILRRAVEGGHALALHSDTPGLLFERPSSVARALGRWADRLEKVTGAPPCRAFRPHAGARSVMLIKGAAQARYTVVGWGFMLWDFNWGKRRTADDLVPRFSTRASAGDIIIIHDGHHRRPSADRQYAVDVVDRLVPALQLRGLQFGTICPTGSARPAFGETSAGEHR
jgi:peptidoglycan-N-acetylglucosamine deacetylase